MPKMTLRCLLGLALLLTGLPSAHADEERMFRMGFASALDPLEAGKVQTAVQYMLLRHLLRPLVSTTEAGTLAGDLAASWSLSGDRLRYAFRLKPGQRFSNGDEITAADVAATLGKRLKQNYAVHYDFSRIAAVHAVSKHEFEIRLRTPDPFFLQELDHPEFRVLHSSDTAEGTPSYRITSGFYNVAARTATSLRLQANPFRPGQIAGPQEALLSFLDPRAEPPLAPDIFLKSDFDLVWSPPRAHRDKLLNAGYVHHRPNLGFTHYVSLNPDTLDAQNRRFLQKILAPGTFAYKDALRHEKALQLYLPSGPGRVPAADIAGWWDGLEAAKEPPHRQKDLAVLVPARLEIADALAETLRSNGYAPRLVQYESFEQYAEMIRSRVFDAVIANNDFSDTDLRGSIAVTFNAERPLMLLPKQPSAVGRLVQQIAADADSESRYAAIRELGLALLRDGYMVPLFHTQSLVLARPDLDLSAWSRSVTQIGLWTVKSGTVPK